MKKITKLTFILLFISFILPNMVLASWWNPFSWFKKTTSTQDKTEILEKKIQELEARLNSATTTIDTPVIKNVATTTINSSSTKNKVQTQTILKNNTDEENLVVEQKLEEQIILNTLKTETDRQNKIEAELRTKVEQDSKELFINDISVDTKTNSARVSWKTSTSTESKLFIEGKTFFSERGVGINHYLSIDGLESNTLYSANITAISNNSWKNQDFSFKTEKEPVKFQPIVTLSKKSINYDGKDYIQIKIETINNDDSIVSDKKAEITTVFGSNYSNIKNLKSDSNGEINYKTPTTNSCEDYCGTSISISIKIDDIVIYSERLPIINVNQVPVPGGNFPGGIGPAGA